LLEQPEETPLRLWCVEDQMIEPRVGVGPDLLDRPIRVRGEGQTCGDLLHGQFVGGPVCLGSDLLCFCSAVDDSGRNGSGLFRLRQWLTGITEHR
jgi:hypothetical protein